MFVIANGAYKGGSTWLYQIAERLPGFQPVPDAFRDPGFKNASLDIARADEFLALDGDFYSKQHWYGRPEHRAIFDHPKSRMLNIVRNLGDVVVSFYYHMKRGGHFSGTFEEYFPDHGLAHARRYIDYQGWWHRDGAPEPFMVSYEGLRQDFRGSATAILDYLGVPADDALLERLAVTDVLHERNKRQVGEGSFFRKAEIGDRRNHLTPEMQTELDALSRELGYDDLLAGIVARFPHCRPTLENA